jgi:hypothetical protein
MLPQSWWLTRSQMPVSCFSPEVETSLGQAQYELRQVVTPRISCQFNATYQ